MAVAPAADQATAPATQKQQQQRKLIRARTLISMRQKVEVTNHCTFTTDLWASTVQLDTTQLCTCWCITTVMVIISTMASTGIMRILQMINRITQGPSSVHL